MARLGEILIKAKLLRESALQTALREQQRWGGLLGEILVRIEAVPEEAVVVALSQQLGIPRPEPTSWNQPHPAALAKVPQEIAKKLRALPLALRDQGKTLVVAMAEPQNLSQVDELDKITGCRISAVIAGPTALTKAQYLHYSAAELGEGDTDTSPFRVVDSQGRTLNEEGGQPQKQGGREAAQPPPAPRLENETAEQLLQLEETQRREVAALRAMVELLIERGIFSRDEYLARVRR
jgi:Type II secretion system (T2SS), protein E, N-terminal domain